MAIVKEQALTKQRKKEIPVMTIQERLKFYATFSFSLIAITGFSVLMFLVPFIGTVQIEIYNRLIFQCLV